MYGTLFFCACAVADAAIAALCIILYSHNEGGEEREWGKIKKCALGHCQGRSRKKSQNIYKKMCLYVWTGVNRFLRWMFELKKGRFVVMMMMKADDGDEKLFSSHFASLRIFFCVVFIEWFYDYMACVRDDKVSMNLNYLRWD